MVFEGFLARVLKNVLGDFVDNLDPSQLNVGIWGGDVRLKNLELKDSTFDAFGYPVKLKIGRLESLIMKIPWNKLYTEPVIVDIEGLYVIITPNRSFVYNEEKARRAEYATKQKELNALEENRRAKRKNKSVAENPQQSSSFKEKLVAHIIKNLQVKIKDIHIRYEDKFSNHDQPFSFGITLESLDFQTTNTEFEPIILKKPTNMFYKLVSLNNLAVYGNYISRILSDSDSEEAIFTILRSTIATRHATPETYRYLFGPISINAKLILNQKPELTKFMIPKVDLTVETKELGFAIDKLQYQDMLYLLEALDRFRVGQPYLKFRPYLTVYHGHYKEWYKFAYNSVVENIHRRRRMWSWEAIKQHRKLVKDYRDAWIHIRTERTPNAAHKGTVEKVEFTLDVFNLNMAREQAEMDIDRLGLVRVEDQAAETWGSWAKGLFGWKPSQENEIAMQFQDALTREEKNKLYAAIDFQENLPPTNYPKDFIENKVSLSVSKVSLIIDRKLNLSVTDLLAEFAQRPSARANQIKSSVKSVLMDGFGEQILNTAVTDKNWLDTEFVTNPLDDEFDYYFGLTTAPVTFKYHAPITSTLVDVFQQPRSAAIAREMTHASFEAMKARSTAGLTYAISKNARLKLKISFAPFIVVLMKGGNYDESAPTLIGKSGSLSIKTVDDIGNFNIGGNANTQINQDIVSKAYQKIHCSMSDIQLCFSDNHRTCMGALTDEKSPHHLINPLRMDLIFCKAVVEDSQIPQYQVFCELPMLRASISDERLTKLLDLVLTFPNPAPTTALPPDKSLNLQLMNLDTHVEATCVDESLSVKEELKVGEPVMKTPSKTKKLSVASSPAKSDTTRLLSETRNHHLCVYKFRVGEISLLLYSRKLQKMRTPLRDDQTTFCALNFTNIAFNGYLTRGGYCQFRLKLRTLTMDDMRVGVRIRRLLEKKVKDVSNVSSAMASANPFAELLYEQSQAGAKRLEFSSSIFYLLLSPEFLGALSKFVVMPENLPQFETAGRPRDAIPTTKRLFLWCIKSGEKNLDSQNGSLSLKCVIKQVDVYLMEDAFHPENSLTLILSFNAALDAKIERQIQCFDGSIQDLQITSTYFTPLRRKEYSYDVLPKTNLCVAGSLEEFKVKLDRIELSVSAVVMRLLKSVATHIFGAKTAEHFGRRTPIRKQSPLNPLPFPTIDWRNPASAPNIMDVAQSEQHRKALAAARKKQSVRRGRVFACYSCIIFLVSMVSMLVGYLICYFF